MLRARYQLDHPVAVTRGRGLKPGKLIQLGKPDIRRQEEQPQGRQTLRPQPLGVDFTIWAVDDVVEPNTQLLIGINRRHTSRDRRSTCKVGHYIVQPSPPVLLLAVKLLQVIDPGEQDTQQRVPLRIRFFRLPILRASGHNTAGNLLPSPSISQAGSRKYRRHRLT